MWLTAIRFKNYRAFQSAELPLQPLTLLIGPNGSGKTSALSAIRQMAAAARKESAFPNTTAPIGMAVTPASSTLEAQWDDGDVTEFINFATAVEPRRDSHFAEHVEKLRSGRVYELDPVSIAATVPLVKTFEIAENGAGLPAVLTTLQDHSPERFAALNSELSRWWPEFDRIVFDTPDQGQRAIALRTVDGGHAVPTEKLSAGTLLGLTLLSICHLPDPPAIIGLEEPDNGLHPRLLRNLKDSLVRLRDPASFADPRSPVQVVVTTHSPYMVDLFRDELDSIVVAKKEGLYSTFARLSDLPHVDEIVRDASLGDAWYSGILGGVPVGS